MMIERSHKIALLMTLCLFTAYGLPAANPADFFRNLASGKKQSVVVYGTSLTEHGAWAKALKDWFDAEYPGRVGFTNSGGSGRNSKWGVANLEKRVLTFQPDLIFIEFSYNDATKQSKLSLRECEKNLHKIVQAIRSQSTSAVIVLQVMNPAWDAPNGKNTSSKRPDVEAYNDVYRTYAREHGLVLLDHYPAWESLKNTDLEKFHLAIPDGSHPSPEASLAVTWPRIKAFLEQAQPSAQPSTSLP